MTHLPLEIGVTRLSREINLPWEITRRRLGNNHGYVKKKKETAHDIFDTKGKRSNQVSSFDTDMKPQKNAFFNGFLSHSWEKLIYVDMADFRFRWQQQEQENLTQNSELVCWARFRNSISPQKLFHSWQVIEQWDTDEM